MSLNKFTHQYLVKKTLRFELVNQSRSGIKLPEYIENQKNIIEKLTKKEKDEVVSKLDEVKRCIDLYYGDQIEDILTHKPIDPEQLNQAFENYQQERQLSKKTKAYKAFKKPTEEQKQEQKEFEKEYDKQKTLLENSLQNLATSIHKNLLENYDQVFNIAKLINGPKSKKTSLLEQWCLKNNLGTQLESIQYFDKKITVYFGYFQQNRDNILGKGSPTEVKQVSLGYRAIYENMLVFFDNILLLEKILAHQEDFIDFYTQYIKKCKSDDPVIQTYGSIGETELAQYQKKSLAYLQEQIGQASQYNHYITQKGIDHYAQILAISGINACINQYNQKQKENSKKIHAFKPLYKQILGGSKKTSAHFLPFQNDQQALEAIAAYQSQFEHYWPLIKKNLCEDLENSHLESIILKADPKTLENVSYRLYGKSHYLFSSLQKQYPELFQPKKDKTSGEIDYQFKEKSITLATIDAVMQKNKSEASDESQNTEMLDCLDFLDFARQHTQQLNEQYQERSGAIKKILDYSCWGLDQKERQAHITTIKNYVDLLKNIEKFLSIFTLKNIPGEIELPVINWQQEYDQLFSQAHSSAEMTLTQLYNKTRNYYTKKAYKVDKIRIFFDKNSLLKGWDINEEDNKHGIIFKKQGLYYLGITLKDKLFGEKDSKDIYQLHKHLLAEASEPAYEKIMVKFIPEPHKQFPNLFFQAKKGTKKAEGTYQPSERLMNTYHPSQEILDIYTQDLFKKTSPALVELEQNLKAQGIKKPKDQLEYKQAYQEHQKVLPQYLVKLIDYYKDCLKNHKEYRHYFDFSTLKESQDYQDISQFYDDVASKAYTLSVQGQIKESAIKQMVENEELFLFLIWNKDFSSFSHSQQNIQKSNMHTIYFKSLFNAFPQNKINGSAQIYFREKSIDKQITHPQGVAIEKKNPLSPGKSQFAYDLIKDKRFSEDKYFFHLSIDLNTHFKTQAHTFNARVNQYLHAQKEEKNSYVIGIDRGERHLLYYSVVDQHGKIQEQGSLNTLKDAEQNYGVNYQELLDQKEQQRQEGRKNWQSIDSIKDLKQGYLSHVMSQITQLMVRYEAPVIMEDLNYGFINSRKKVEKQVYQNFERALVNKLEYLVLKNQVRQENFQVHFPAYQLVPHLDKWNDKSKQIGFIFYVMAAYTSKVDPLTGFVNNQTRFQFNGQPLKESSFFKMLKSVRFDREKQYFQFQVEFVAYDRSKQSITICSTPCLRSYYGYARDQKKSISEKKQNHLINVNEQLKQLFQNYHIDYEQGHDLKASIMSQEDKFFKSFSFLLKNLLAMRYALPNKDDPQVIDDVLISPVANQEGLFFNSQALASGQYEWFDYQPKDGELWPLDADANGAYHIALKGLYAITHMQKDKKEQWTPEFLKNTDWWAILEEKLLSQT